MLSEFTANVVDFAARLLSGGVFELVVFVILVVLAIVVVIVAVWVLWKLLVLLAKGLLWLAKTTFAFGREHGAARRERRLGALPRVATGWSSRSRMPLRAALSQARRTAGENALRIVVVANEGSFGDLCAGVGATTPAPATFGIAARDGLVLIDASQASLADLRALGRSLPWSRALDAAAVVVRDESVPADALVRTGAFARACGLELALHFVISSPSRAPVWALFGRARPDGRSLCDSLSRDASRWWLGGGSREGLDQLVGTRSLALASDLDRAIGAVPSPTVRFASLALGGAGLAAAVSQSTSLTRPARTTAISSRALYAAGIGLVALSVYSAMALFHRAHDLYSAVETAEREASTTWLLSDVDTVPNPARVYRVVRSAMRLSEMSGFVQVAPLAALLPEARAPRDLGAALFEAYLLRPLSAALTQKIETDLVPVEDARGWLVQARRAGEWLAAWNGLAEEPEQVDLSTLLSHAFGDQASAWPDRPEQALTLSLAKVPAPEDGGLDVPYLSMLVRDRFVETMSLWARGVYTNGPVAAAARVVADERADWHRRYRALVALRQSLSDPAQRWITAAKDESDYRYESWIYGRSVGMAVLGTGATVEAKAAVSAIRITAREAATTFTAPGARTDTRSFQRGRLRWGAVLARTVVRSELVALAPGRLSATGHRGAPAAARHPAARGAHSARCGRASREGTASSLRPARRGRSAGASVRRFRRVGRRGRGTASGGNAQRGRARGTSLRPVGLRGPAHRRPLGARIGDRGARRNRDLVLGTRSVGRKRCAARHPLARRAYGARGGRRRAGGA